MAEHQICIHCRKPINLQTDDYVITNKDKVQYDNEWRYAHVKCQQEKG